MENQIFKTLIQYFKKSLYVYHDLKGITLDIQFGVVERLLIESATSRNF